MTRRAGSWGVQDLGRHSASFPFPPGPFYDNLTTCRPLKSMLHCDYLFERLGSGPSVSMRCMDARAEGSFDPHIGAETIHKRPRPLCAPSSLGAREPVDEYRAVDRREARPPREAVVGNVVHEGLWPGCGEQSSATPGHAHMAVAADLSTPAIALLARRRAGRRRRGRRLRRALPSPPRPSRSPRSSNRSTPTRMIRSNRSDTFARPCA